MAPKKSSNGYLANSQRDQLVTAGRGDSGYLANAQRDQAAASQSRYGYLANTERDQQVAAGQREPGYLANTQGDHQEVTGEGNRDVSQSAPCQICSKPGREVSHRHFSSKFGRIICGVENKTSTCLYHCPSCMKSHATITTNRIKLVISDSTLHVFWAPPGEEIAVYSGDKDHKDYITIPGAKIAQLHDAFVAEYGKEQRGIDVVLVAGLNDVKRNYSRDWIVYSYRNMYDAVMTQAAKNHPEIKNTFAVATLLYPPQLAWFEDNGPLPYPEYQNNLEKIDWINEEIRKDNIEVLKTPNAPRLHTLGVRTDNRERKDKYGNVVIHHTKAHRWGEWREADPANMLHLSNKKRVVMAKMVAKYFEFNTDNTLWNNVI